MKNYQVLCYGDSNTWGYIPVTGGRYAPTVRWTGVMAEQLGPQFSAIEEGQSGRTTVWDDPLEGDKNGLRYLPACLESHMPLDLVILMLGTNDLKARFSLTALDYLGFGLPPEYATWGRLLNDGLANLSAPWLVSSTFTVLVAMLILITFVGEAIREAFDPKKFTYYR